MNNYKSAIINNKVYSFLQNNKIDVSSSISGIKSDIENDIISKGLLFRIGRIDDIETLSAFQREIFHPHTATLESEYELYRIMKFGYALLIENTDKKIVGCYTTVHYQGSNNKTGYGIRVSISPGIAGHNFAAKLARYATILAYENGCVNFSALMSPENFRSASNVLNHIGYYCTRFHKSLPSFGARFEITLPLSPKILGNMEVDTEKIVSFIKAHTINKDFLLLEPTDIDRMSYTYSSTDFRIIAFLRKGIVDCKDYFFAIKLLNRA